MNKAVRAISAKIMLRKDFGDALFDRFVKMLREDEAIARYYYHDPYWDTITCIELDDMNAGIHYRLLGDEVDAERSFTGIDVDYDNLITKTLQILMEYQELNVAMDTYTESESIKIYRPTRFDETVLSPGKTDVLTISSWGDGTVSSRTDVILLVDLYDSYSVNELGRPDLSNGKPSGLLKGNKHESSWLFRSNVGSRRSSRHRQG